jgi:hypothetical protein
MAFLAHIFWTVLAALFLVEAWLWTYVGGAIKALVALLPIEPLRRLFQRLIAKLPPPAVLVVFVVPVLALLPLKFLALALIAKKQLIAAGCVYFVAKTVGLGLTAFLFDACRDKLMQMRWFARLYDWTMRALAWAHAKVDPYKARIKAQAARLRLAIISKIGGSGRFGRKVALLREQIQKKIS